MIYKYDLIVVLGYNWNKLFESIVIILFLIAFNAIAKVEVWLCNSKHGIDVFKIDITEPHNISQRKNRSWKKFLTSEQITEVADVVYEPQNQLIKIILEVL